MKKETILGSAGSVSGITSVISSAQACHNICVSSFSTLSILGAASASLPLFIVRAATPLWFVGLALYAVLVYLFLFRRGVRPGFLLLNGGILLAGLPFQPSGSAIFFLITGSVIALAGLVNLVWQRFRKP